jgi:general stress protein 26
MDYINLINRDAVEKMRALAKRAQTGFLQTRLDHVPPHGRPMIVIEVDDEGKFWFFSKANSHKNADINLNNKVEVIFSRPHTSEFLDVFGEAKIILDREKMKELWTPALRPWIEDGKDDPDLTLICVKPIEAHYWDTKHNTAVMLFKGVMNALTGITMNGDVQGELKVNEYEP